MTGTALLDRRKFAERVERLCDFLLGRLYTEVGRNGSDEQKILEDLRDDAAEMQQNVPPTEEVLTGLKDFMGGLTPEPIKES